MAPPHLHCKLNTQEQWRISSPLINNQTGELLLFVSWPQHGYVGCHVLKLWFELTNCNRKKLRLQFVVNDQDVRAVQSGDSCEKIPEIRESAVFPLCCLRKDSSSQTEVYSTSQWRTPIMYVFLSIPCLLCRSTKSRGRHVSDKMQYVTNCMLSVSHNC